jgi:hypothetical protein
MAYSRGNLKSGSAPGLCLPSQRLTVKKSLCATVICWFLFGTSLQSQASPPDGVWKGVLSGPGLNVVLRVAGGPGHYTATSDSPDQQAVALPTEFSCDANNNVTIKVDVASPLIFTGVLNGNQIAGTWSQAGGSGSLTLMLLPAPATTPPPVALAGTWTGVVNGPNLHLAVHIYGGPMAAHIDVGPISYAATVDSIDQHAYALATTFKIDTQNNVFLTIAVQTPFHYTGYLTGTGIAGTWTQGTGIGSMTLIKQ